MSSKKKIADPCTSLNLLLCKIVMVKVVTFYVVVEFLFLLFIWILDPRKSTRPTSFIVPQSNAYFGNPKFLHSYLIYIRSNSTMPPTIYTNQKFYTNQTNCLFFLTFQRKKIKKFVHLHNSY